MVYQGTLMLLLLCSGKWFSNPHVRAVETGAHKRNSCVLSICSDCLQIMFPRGGNRMRWLRLLPPTSFSFRIPYFGPMISFQFSKPYHFNLPHAHLSRRTETSGHHHAWPPSFHLFMKYIKLMRALAFSSWYQLFEEFNFLVICAFSFQYLNWISLPFYSYFFILLLSCHVKDKSMLESVFKTQYLRMEDMISIPSSSSLQICDLG